MHLFHQSIFQTGRVLAGVVLTPNCINARHAAYKAMFRGTEMPKLRSK